jgi:hypothetical protein
VSSAFSRLLPMPLSHTQYSCIPGQIAKRSYIRILLVVWATVNLVMTRSNFVENKQPRMAYNTSRLIPAILISQILTSLQQLSILCSAGIEMQRDVMCTLRM